MTPNTQQHLPLVMGTLMQKLEHLESTVRELQMARTCTLASIDTLLETCFEDQKPHLQSIKTVLVAQSYHLKKYKDSITITMTNFSLYKQSGKV